MHITFEKFKLSRIVCMQYQVKTNTFTPNQEKKRNMKKICPPRYCLDNIENDNALRHYSSDAIFSRFFSRSIAATSTFALTGHDRLNPVFTYIFAFNTYSACKSLQRGSKQIYTAKAKPCESPQATAPKSSQCRSLQLHRPSSSHHFHV